MVKKHKKLDSIPRKWKIIGLASLIVNAIILVAIIVFCVLARSGSLDYAIINTGYDTLCSDRFRSTVQENTITGASPNEYKARIALLDYQCARNGAEIYYGKGFEDYARSLGITTE